MQSWAAGRTRGWDAFQTPTSSREVYQGLNTHKARTCYVRVYVQPLSRVRLSVAPWTGACQAPLSMGFPRQEYWSGLSCPPPGDLPDSRDQTHVSYIAGGFFTAEPPGKPLEPFKIILFLLKTVAPLLHALLVCDFFFFQNIYLNTLKNISLCFILFPVLFLICYLFGCSRCYLWHAGF